MAKTSATRHREIAARIECTLDQHDRPLALVGRSGCGKTTRDLADTIVDAIRGDAQDRVLAALGEEARPLAVEHLEDLREKPRTLEELRRLLEVRAHHGGAVFLTLTNRPGAEDVLRWLTRHADVARPAKPVSLPL